MSFRDICSKPWAFATHRSLSKRTTAGDLGGFSKVLEGISGPLTTLSRLLFLWYAAALFWSLAAPGTEERRLSVPLATHKDRSIPSDALLRWYGAGESSADAPKGDLGLIAVIAGKHGAALFKDASDKYLAARVGQEIRPGTRLIEVLPTQASVEYGGLQQILKLPRADTASPLTEILSPSREKGGTTGKKEFILVTRGELLGALQGRDVGSWERGLAARADGGLRVEQASAQPFAQVLHLQDGDILKSINGRPLNQIADISMIAHAFGQQAEVTLSLIRNGALRAQHYRIQP